MKVEKVAVLDLGTNTFNLLIASITNKGYEILSSEKQPVMIGKGGINRGFITPEAMNRAIAALCIYKEKIDSLNIKKVFCFATSAFRNARNGRDLALKIKGKTGLSVEIISGEKEAEYIYYGVKQALSIGEDKSLIVDIGGGSVEFIIASDEKTYWKKSFEIGAQRLLDMFHKHDPMPEDEVENLMNYLEFHLTSLHSAIKRFKPQSLIGSSGTFDTLSDIYRAENSIGIDEDSTEFPLTVSAFQAIHHEIIEKNKADRLKIPGMIEMRVDMIVVATCLVHYLVSRYNFDNIRVSAYSLKEGMLEDIQHVLVSEDSQSNII